LWTSPAEPKIGAGASPKALSAAADRCRGYRPGGPHHASAMRRKACPRSHGPDRRLQPPARQPRCATPACR
jgi:hypothetical protein